ncbi:hypothetical protein D3C86_1008080 [compost metagenome]
MRDQAGDTGELLAAHAPDVQVGDARAVFALLEAGQHLSYFVHHRVVHLAVQQHRAALPHQADGPAADQRRAHQPHHRIEPAPAQPPAAGQRHDGQHRGGRIGHHVEIGRAQVDVVMVVTGMSVVMVPMLMTMVVPVMMVRAAEDERAAQVHQQADGGDGHRLLVVDGLRAEQPFHRSEHHQRGHPQQEDGAGEGRQHLDFPRAEGEAPIRGQPARGGVGEGREANRQRVRTHVPAVGQQGHRVEPEAGGNLHHHRGECDPHDQACAALGSLVAGIEDVGMGPRGQIVRVHVGKGLGDAAQGYQPWRAWSPATLPAAGVAEAATSRGRARSARTRRAVRPESRQRRARGPRVCRA